MIHAYQGIYLNRAQATLGEAFDYAVNDCYLSGADFAALFAASSISKRMEKGEPSLLAGKSGPEVAADILLETTGAAPQVPPKEHLARSGEYWIGWAIAYYQWYSGRSYSDILKAVSFDELQKMYPTLHEADISKFTEILDARIQAVFPEPNLKRLRKAYGCSQSELAKRSGVSLRSIQMYEQRKKDISKASAETVLRLSRVLGCGMEDLIQK